jgi:hypothetical protein
LHAGSLQATSRIGWDGSATCRPKRSAAIIARLVLELTYDRSAAADVHEFVRREQACCGFLHFEVRESADAVHLTITAPPEAESAADELFAHFAA